MLCSTGEGRIHLVVQDFVETLRESPGIDPEPSGQVSYPAASPAGQAGYPASHRSLVPRRIRRTALLCTKRGGINQVCPGIPLGDLPAQFFPGVYSIDGQIFDRNVQKPGILRPRPLLVGKQQRAANQRGVQRRQAGCTRGIDDQMVVRAGRGFRRRAVDQPTPGLGHVARRNVCIPYVCFRQRGRGEEKRREGAERGFHDCLHGCFHECFHVDIPGVVFPFAKNYIKFQRKQLHFHPRRVLRLTPAFDVVTMGPETFYSHHLLLSLNSNGVPTV